MILVSWCQKNSVTHSSSVMHHFKDKEHNLFEIFLNICYAKLSKNTKKNYGMRVFIFITHREYASYLIKLLIVRKITFSNICIFRFRKVFVFIHKNCIIQKSCDFLNLLKILQALRTENVSPYFCTNKIITCDFKKVYICI